MCNAEFYKTCNVLHSIVSPGFSLVQFLSHARLVVTPRTAVSQAFLSFTVSQSLLKIMSIELIMPSNHLILCPPLLLPSSLPSNRVFFNKSALQIRCSRYWSFNFSISPASIQGWFTLGLISLWSKGLKRLLQIEYYEKDFPWIVLLGFLHVLNMLNSVSDEFREA